ncbi:CPBP family archaeomyxosortase MrtA [Pyrococcus sp. ST04]|uniref:CPBP family archaeomyxosortase MrtA n=1 Tax=Pyrococcus sp. ST04 TaxID=1183377 RepID=UPI0002605F50|nr:CPBP family archaeomyxosortase MrtA [Pyrococcus sp. ST04]AFK23296.1 hypothetical protein Py04_1727 [Pyrococcus sp. ST04]
MRRELLFALILLPLSFIPMSTSLPFYPWASLVFLVYFLVPLTLVLALGLNPKDVGIKKPKSWKTTAILLGIAAILSFIGLLDESMKSYYPRFSYSNWLDFIWKEIVFGIVMFSHEAFFRGFLLFPMAKKNPRIAILYQDIPYTLIHIGKPSIEIPYAFLAGIIFAKIDLKEESILPSFLIHWLGSVFFDFLCAIT